MIGGLGGFVLPIAFGALNDLTGLWSSCFMLLFVIVAGLLVWMDVSVRRMQRGDRPRLRSDLHLCSRMIRRSPHMTEKLVIIGNGMAPGRMLEHLLEAAPGRYEVTIFNAEPRVNYDRIMLSPVLSGEKDYEQIIIHGDGWYIKNGITLYKGHKIVAIDRAAKTVTSDHGVTAPYDKLVIATGSVPFILPVPGNNLAGRADLSRSRRRPGDAACRAIAGQGRGHRRRPARPRSGGRPRSSAAWTSPCCI